MIIINIMLKIYNWKGVGCLSYETNFLVENTLYEQYRNSNFVTKIFFSKNLHDNSIYKYNDQAMPSSCVTKKDYRNARFKYLKLDFFPLAHRRIFFQEDTFRYIRI